MLDEIYEVPEPFAISYENHRTYTQMSWVQLISFCKAHDVPLYFIGDNILIRWPKLKAALQAAELYGVYLRPEPPRLRLV